METNIILSPISLDSMASVFTAIVRQEIKAAKTEELQDKLLSPEATCRLFEPSISVATLNNYAKEGLIKKHYLGRLTFYKYSEIMEALKSIKKYSRKTSVINS